MKIVRKFNKKWINKEGYSKKIFLDEKDLKHPGALVQLLKVKPRDGAKPHYHKKQTEVFYFLNANGYFIVNGKKIKPKIGDILVIEPHDMHTAINNAKKDYVYIVFKVNYDKKDSYWD